MISTQGVPVCVSPLGAVPKDETKIRVIRDYSTPKGSSLNDGIPDRFAKVSYVSHQQIAKKICQQGPGCYISKIDLKSAFRQIPINSNDIRLLGHRLYGQYVLDARLPFGVRSACLICQAMGIAAIFIHDCDYTRPELRNSISLFVDDYISISHGRSTAYELYNSLKTCLSDLGFQINNDKCVPPHTTQEVLGLLYDTVSMTVSLSQKKLEKYMSLIEDILDSSTVSYDKLHSLIGSLQFCCTVVFPASAFLQNFRNLLYSHKPNDIINLNSETVLDLLW